MNTWKAEKDLMKHHTSIKKISIAIYTWKLLQMLTIGVQK